MTPKSMSSIFSRSSRDTNGSGTNVQKVLRSSARKHATAQRGLSRAGLAGQDDEAFAAADARAQLVERRRRASGSCKGSADRRTG